MLAQKPHLELVGSQHLTDEEIVCAVVTELGREPDNHSYQGNNDLMSVGQSGKLYGYFFPCV